MAKSSKWGNIVFYKTKDGQLRWFDPDKAKTPEGKAKIKAIRMGKQVSDTGRGKITEMDEDRITNAKKALNKKNKNKNKVADRKAMEEWRKAVDKNRKAEDKAFKNVDYLDSKDKNNADVLKNVRKTAHDRRTAYNETEYTFARAHNPENWHKDKNGNAISNREQRNIERAQKKAETRKFVNEINSNKKLAGDDNLLSEKKANQLYEKSEDGKWKTKDFKGVVNKLHGHDLNKKSAEAQAKRKDKKPSNDIEALKKAGENLRKVQLNNKLTNATGERKRKALNALQKVNGAKEANASIKASNDQLSAMEKHAKVMDDADSTAKEMNQASRALRTATNEAVRHGANPKNFPTTQGRKSRDELNLERARNKAKVRNHANEIREVMNKEEYGGLGDTMVPRNKAGDKYASFFEKTGENVRPNPRKIDEYKKYEKGQAQNYISEGKQKTKAKQNNKLSNATGERKTKAVEALKKKKENAENNSILERQRAREKEQSKAEEVIDRLGSNSGISPAWEGIKEGASSKERLEFNKARNSYRKISNEFDKDIKGSTRRDELNMARAKRKAQERAESNTKKSPITEMTPERKQKAQTALLMKPYTEKKTKIKEKEKAYKQTLKEMNKEYKKSGSTNKYRTLRNKLEGIDPDKTLGEMYSDKNKYVEYRKNFEDETGTVNRYELNIKRAKKKARERKSAINALKRK